jgi:hypothetical protein
MLNSIQPRTLSFLVAFRRRSSSLFAAALAALVTFASAVPAARAADNQLSRKEKKDGWTLLFDGASTKGWRSFKKQSFPENGWSVKEGILELAANSKAGDIITDKTFWNFDLKWDWKIPAAANNGLKYFITEERSQAVGHEYQMIDDKGGHDSGPKHSTASFYDVLPPDPNKPLKEPGQWNHSRILVQGNHVEHWLNGKKVLEYELGSPEVLEAVQHSKFKSVPGFGTHIRGHILLTYHTDAVSYKNIKIRELP